MERLTHWIWAGVKSPSRLVFMLLLVFVGALALGEAVSPVRNFVGGLFHRDGPEAAEMRLKMLQLQTAIKHSVAPVCKSTNELSKEIERRSRLVAIRDQVKRLKEGDGKNAKEWDTLLESYDTKIRESDERIKGLAPVLITSRDVEEALRKLDALRNTCPPTTPGE